jgi:hypothetical protein
MSAIINNPEGVEYSYIKIYIHDMRENPRQGWKGFSHAPRGAEAQRSPEQPGLADRPVASYR